MMIIVSNGRAHGVSEGAYHLTNVRMNLGLVILKCTAGIRNALRLSNWSADGFQFASQSPRFSIGTRSLGHIGGPIFKWLRSMETLNLHRGHSARAGLRKLSYMALPTDSLACG